MRRLSSLAMELGRAQQGDPLLLGLRNLYIVPTRFGWLWLGGLALLQLVGIQMRSNGSLLLSFLMLGLFLLSLHLTHFNLQGLELTLDEPPPGFAGSPLVLPLRLSVRSRCEGLQLRLEGEPPTAPGNLGPGRHRLPLTWTPQRRGLQHPGVLRLQTTAPLGLCVCWTRWRVPRPQLVYPARRPGPVREVPLPRATPSVAESRLGRREGSETWTDLRRHRPEDLPSRLAWKLLAQGRGSFSKQFSDQRPTAWLLAPDPALPLETALEHLSDRLWRLQAEGALFGLETADGVLGPDRGPAHRDRCLAALALWPAA
ncbi:MAG: hypothetical protein VKK62_04230 [Synechococcaceae cyanobacterium]|nr:hypothetical protein [Synechococcaceae cyanobacterium]